MQLQPATCLLDTRLKLCDHVNSTLQGKLVYMYIMSGGGPNRFYTMPIRLLYERIVKRTESKW
jgi:hypothetical protein